MAPTSSSGAGAPGGIGALALIGSDPWAGGGGLDEELAALVENSGGELVLLPTAAAYERPDRLVAGASDWFGRLGGRVEACMVLRRADSEERSHAEMLRRARLVYLAGGSPLHLRSVLKDSTVLASLIAAWHDGAVIAGAGAASVVLTDPMVDPRGGAFSVGLGLVRDLAVVPGYDGTTSGGLERTLALAPPGVAVVCLPASAMLVREPDGSWRAAGAGAREPGLAVYAEGEEAGLAALAGKAVG